MIKPTRTSTATLVLAGGAVLLLPAQAEDTVVFEPIVFETIKHPDFEGMGPGPDGFVGTADDVADSNNAAGTFTYGISTRGPLLYSESTTTINEPYVFENGTSTITDFVTSGTLEPGFSFTDITHAPTPGGSEVPVVHEMVTQLQGGTDGEYTIEVCPTCYPPQLARHFNHSSRGEGFLLRRGQDPALLPGIDSDLASYFNTLQGYVPAEWTAIAVKVGGLVPKCADWHPEEEGYCLVTEQTTTDTYFALQPSPDEVCVLKNNGTPGLSRFIYQNFGLLTKLVDDGCLTTLNFSTKQLCGDYGDLEANDYVGVVTNLFRLEPDGICVLESPGYVVTKSGEEAQIPGMAGEYIARPYYGETIGGVVATVSTSPIEFFVESVFIDIETDPPLPFESDPTPDGPADPFLFSVTIVGPHTFDVADVDVTTLAFGPAGARPVHPTELAEHDGEHLEYGPVEGSSLEFVKFEGTSYPPTPEGSISGDFGVYHVPSRPALVPLVASKIDNFVATGFGDADGSFTGWKNVFGSVYLYFTDESVELTGDGNADGAGAPYDAFIEDNQLVWHLHSGSATCSGKGGCSRDPTDRFDSVSPRGLHEGGGLLVSTATTVPPEFLVSHYSSDETGLQIGNTVACITGETNKGVPFKGCVPEPSSSLLRGAGLVVLGLLVSRRRRIKHGQMIRNQGHSFAPISSSQATTWVRFSERA